MPHQRCSQRFLWRERLRLKRDYDRVFRLRCSAGDSNLVVYVAANELGWSRLGLSVSRRVGNAIVRNAARRRIREAFRLSKEQLPTGIDIVCVVRAGGRTRAADLTSSLSLLVHRAYERCQVQRG